MADRALSWLAAPCALVLGKIRRTGVEFLPRCRAMFRRIGVFPIVDHYYEPLFREDGLRRPLSEPRSLPGIEWNIEEQLALLGEFRYSEELLSPAAGNFPWPDDDCRNTAFALPDAVYLYNLLRMKKPRRIVEVGCGNSTCVAFKAAWQNRRDDPAYACEHVCIEPYEVPWLEQAGGTVLRQRVEDVAIERFLALGENDLLFIDSSHVIRPQGDVLFLYLQVLPALRKGVMVHVHDVFTPRDYPEEWVCKAVRFWNEQYLLEALLTATRDWRILGAVNYLYHDQRAALAAKCPGLASDEEPGSFYIRKIR
jgi:hypothetical protein